MFEQGYITKEQQEEALADDVYARIQMVDNVSKENSTPYSYFTDELTQQVKDTLMEKLGYTETQAHNLLYSGGLQIYTTPGIRPSRPSWMKRSTILPTIPLPATA